jgi:glycerol-3-phosphate acyltransferase PlsY
VSALFVIDWRVALILLGLFILIVLATRYVSLGSCISSALCPVAVWILSGGNEIGTFFAAIVALILVLKHKENIKRLVAGEEKKLGQKS